MTDKVSVFKTLCTNINQHESLHVPSPPSQQRRAGVAAILRWKPNSKVDLDSKNNITTIEEFFQQSWVNQDGEAEILFMQRAKRAGDRWSGHVSFVGGKNEDGETDQDTVEREVMEEIGIDLKSSDYIQVGKLDEREITTVRDNKLLMILVPFVYLQVVPESPMFHLQESEVAAVEWVPLSFFLSRECYPYRPMTERLGLSKSNNRWLTPLIRFMMGTVTFQAIDLPTSPNTLFRLWGLTMGMTRDIIEFTNLDHKHLAFLKLTQNQPVYSRPDIGWITTVITYITFQLKKNKSTITIRNRHHTRSLWDKIYFKSIRKGIMVAVLLRLGFTSIIISLIIRRVITLKK